MWASAEGHTDVATLLLNSQAEASSGDKVKPGSFVTMVFDTSQ
jgi:hypothetical protein